MTRTIVIAGSGPSAASHAFAHDVPIMAIGSAWSCVPSMDHFVTVDKPMCFPRWVTDSDRFYKHTWDWTDTKWWRGSPRVTAWAYEDADGPTFDGPIASGPLRKANTDDRRHHSMLFAVQVAARLGYRRFEFVGCDLLPESLYPISDTLRAWYPRFADRGIEWFNLSPISTLAEWMPSLEGSAA